MMDGHSDDLSWIKVKTMWLGENTTRSEAGKRFMDDERGGHGEGDDRESQTQSRVNTFIFKIIKCI